MVNVGNDLMLYHFFKVHNTIFLVGYIERIHYRAGADVTERGSA